MRNSLLVICVITMAFAGAMVITSCTHKSAVLPDVSFKNEIMPIIRTNCAISSSCHVGSSNANDHIDLTDSLAYGTIWAKGMVNVYMPAASLLYVETANGLMPKAPYGHLSGAQVSLILDWIKQGGKNN